MFLLLFQPVQSLPDSVLQTVQRSACQGSAAAEIALIPPEGGLTLQFFFHAMLGIEAQAELRILLFRLPFGERFSRCFQTAKLD